MKLLHNLLGLTASFCLIIVLLISSVEFVVYGIPGYFEREYTKYGVMDTVDIELADLMYVTDEMMDYLKGKRADLHIDTIIGGESKEFFNQKEIDHMEDVRDLFSAGMQLRTTCILILVCAVAVLLILKARLLTVLPRMIQAGTVLFFGILAVLGGYIALDFTRAFNLFHKILFTNDLWILDPAVDRLINIVPEPFFIDTALYIGSTFGVLMTALLIISSCLRRKNKL